MQPSFPGFEGCIGCILHGPTYPKILHGPTYPSQDSLHTQSMEMAENGDLISVFKCIGLGQRHSTNPPVLIASIPENTPGPSTASTAVVDQEVEDKDQEEERQRGPRSRKRDREENMFQSRSLSSEMDSRFTCSESTSTA
ncbi:unnamed protein product [Gadus morhua 'NCC']